MYRSSSLASRPPKELSTKLPVKEQSIQVHPSRLQELMQYIHDDELMRFYKSKEWRNLRLQAIERDNGECQHCKLQGKVTTRNTKTAHGKPTKMDVNHIQPVKTHPHLALTLSNLEYLCVDCHNIADGKDILMRKHTKTNKFYLDERW